VAFGKTPEQKVAEEQRRLAVREAQHQEWAAINEAYEEEARQERLANENPISQATTAKEQGQGFFEIQLEVGSSQRDTTIFGGNNDNIEKTKTRSHAGTLAAIEAIGWRLEHVGHVFVITSESSRNKLLLTGQQTAVSGNTIGIYLFRNID
jgi:uncharacterized caspase-like protein